MLRQQKNPPSSNNSQIVMQLAKNINFNYLIGYLD